MANGKIDADKEILQVIFSTKFWFVIPEYQRSYVWQVDNIQELIDDLYFAFTNKPNNEYFLGSLVLKKTSNEQFAEYEVLDGQQRLTTFFLMLAVLRDLLPQQHFKSNLQQKIYQEEDVLDMVPERQRITYQIRDSVEDFIKKYVIKFDGTTLVDDLKIEAEKDNLSISNMANAIITLREQLEDKENLSEFIRFLFNKALLIYVSTDNTEDAFRMFTILNNRGIPLTSADILKSMNIGQLQNERDVKKYAKYWEEIEGRFGEGFDRFLNFVRTVLVKEKARTNLLEEFEIKVYKEGILKQGQETLDFIKQYDDVYENVIELGDGNLSNEFKNLLTIMRIGFRSEDWIPPLMFYYAKFKTQNLDQFLKKLEYKFAGDWIVGVNSTPRLEAMNNILKAIEKTDETTIDALLNNPTIFNVDIDELQRNIDRNVYKKQFAKYLLLKIEYLMGDNTVHLTSYKNISVEHILPQNPSINSKWCVMFTEDERELWTNKLANLVLICKIKNSTLSNLDFEEKKQRYLTGRIDAFNASKIFIEQNLEWRPQVLENRQSKIIRLLVNNG